MIVEAAQTLLSDKNKTFSDTYNNNSNMYRLMTHNNLSKNLVNAHGF